jgi:hypothetical protein
MIINHCGGKIGRDDAKALFLRLLYGGSWSGFVIDLTKSSQGYLMAIHCRHVQS